MIFLQWQHPSLFCTDMTIQGHTSTPKQKKSPTSHSETPRRRLNSALLVLTQAPRDTVLKTQPTAFAVGSVREPSSLRSQHGFQRTLLTQRVSHSMCVACVVQECREMVALLKEAGYEVDSLGDLDDELYAKATEQFGEPYPHLCRRMKYVYDCAVRFVCREIMT